MGRRRAVRRGRPVDGEALPDALRALARVRDRALADPGGVAADMDDAASDREPRREPRHHLKVEKADSTG